MSAQACSPFRRFMCAAAVVVWLCAVGSGFGVLLRYEFTPGLFRPAEGPALVRPDGRPVLVMAVHPRCPCTRASVAELARLAPFVRERAKIVVLVYRPDNQEDEWAQVGRWEEAACIPGVEMVVDPGARRARSLGLVVSGAAALLDGDGTVLFRGGITPGRGHEGANPGSSAILGWAKENLVPAQASFVFGCSLAEPCPGGESVRAGSEP